MIGNNDDMHVCVIRYRLWIVYTPVLALIACMFYLWGSVKARHRVLSCLHSNALAL